MEFTVIKNEGYKKIQLKLDFIYNYIRCKELEDTTSGEENM